MDDLTTDFGREQARIEAARRSGLGTIRRMRVLLDDLATFRNTESESMEKLAEIKAGASLLGACFKVYGTGLPASCGGGSKEGA